MKIWREESLLGRIFPGGGGMSKFLAIGGTPPVGKTPGGGNYKR